MSWLDRFFKQGYATLQSGGSPVAPETVLNFVSGATVVDDPANGRTNVTISGGGGATGTCTLEQFGAKGDNVTNDAAALDAALAAVGAGTYGAIILGAKTYYVPGLHTVPSGCVISGQGDNSVLRTDSNTTMLRCATNAVDITLQNFKAVANATGTAQIFCEVGQDGVIGSGVTRFRALNLTIQSFATYGLAFSRPPQLNPGDLYYGPQVHACRVRYCGKGILITQSCEYGKVTNTDVRDSVAEGVWVGAGNWSFVGCNITFNGTNVRLTAGVNDTHGEFVGCNINHPTAGAAGTSVLADSGILNGHTFTGCHFYQGNWTINASTCVFEFTGCMVDPDTVSNAGRLRFTNCIFPLGYTNSWSESGNGFTEFVSAENALDGSTPSFARSRVHRPYVFASDANQTLGYQDSIAESLRVSGTITATRTLTSPWTAAQARTQRVVNRTGQSVVYQWSSGGGVTVPAGTWALISSDGSNAICLEAGTLVADGAFDPSTLAWTGWWRASYSGSPWAGVASAGTSGAKSLPTAAGSNAPTTGAALNGLVPASFTAASTQAFSYVVSTLDALISAGAYTYTVLVNPNNPGATNANPYSEQQILGDTGAVWGLTYSTSGVRAFHQDSGGIKATGYVAIAANTWSLVDVKYDGTNIQIRVNGGAWTTVAAGSAVSLNATNFRVGRNFSTTYTNMLLAEIGIAASTFADGTLNSFRTSYIDPRYALSL